MTQSHHDENRPLSMEEKLTAWVLGELPEAEVPELEAALAADPKLSERKAALESTLGLLRQQAPQPELAPERLEALKQAAAAAAGAAPGASTAGGATTAAGSGRPMGKLLTFSRLQWAAAALVFIGGFYVAAGVADRWAPSEVENAASLPKDAGMASMFDTAGRADDESVVSLGELGYTDGQHDDRNGARRPALEAEGKGEGDAYRNVDADAGFAVGQSRQEAFQALGYAKDPAGAGRFLEESDVEDLLPALKELGYGGNDGVREKAREEPRPIVGALQKNEPAPAEGAPGLRYADQTGEAINGLSATEPMGGDAKLGARLGFRGAGDTVPPSGATPPGTPSSTPGPAPPSTPALPSTRSTPATPGAAASPPPARSGGQSARGGRAIHDRPVAAGERVGEERVEGATRRFADDDRGELPELLDQLGYVQEESEPVGGDFQRRGRTVIHGQQRDCIRDGYGREWCGEQIIRYLHPVHGKESPRDMFFRYYGDNPRVLTERDALSTFAADVDTASYPLVRNYLVNRQLPPKEAVRTEEFLNYFQNELAPPREGDFAIHLDHAPSIFGGDGTRLVKVGIKAREVGRADRKPMNLVFVIDRSGSMAKQNRIELVKRSLELLVDQLREDDTVGIVTFESRGHKELDPTPGYERWQIREAIRKLQTGGSTNAEAGLILGYEMAERAFREGAINRVVLCSDGVANTGETDQAKILERVRNFSERQIDLTAIGVGMGNHNDVFLEQIADKGNGSCHYVDDFEEAKRVFVEQFTGTLQTIARDVKIQVEFDPKTVAAWRQLGYENRSIADQDFRNDSVDAGEVGAGHEVVALYEVTLMPKVDAEANLATVRLRWFPDGVNEATEIERTTSMGEGSERFGLADARFRLSAVAAQYAEVLRRSYWAREDSYAELMRESEELVRALRGDAQVRELRDMIRRTRRLIDALPEWDELTMLVEEARSLRLLEAEARQVEERSSYLESRLEELHKRNQELEDEIRKLIGIPR